jgi:hypothetical protein
MRRTSGCTILLMHASPDPGVPSHMCTSMDTLSHIVSSVSSVSELMVVVTLSTPRLSPFPRHSSSTTYNDGIIFPVSCHMLGDLFGGCGGMMWFIHRPWWQISWDKVLMFCRHKFIESKEDSIISNFSNHHIFSYILRPSMGCFLVPYILIYVEKSSKYQSRRFYRNLIMSSNNPKHLFSYIGLYMRVRNWSDVFPYLDEYLCSHRSSQYKWTSKHEIF